MRFDVFTLFPDVFFPYLDASIIKKARDRNHVEVAVHDIRDFTTDKHHVTDEPPYGGGGGMVLKPEPIFRAVESVLGSPPAHPVLLLSPQGELLTQDLARDLANQPRLGLIAGHYEGVDERVRDHLVDQEISIGDYVLTGGELPALVLIDCLTRLLPGVLGDPDAAEKDSHAAGLLEHPHYTRPEKFREWTVPEILRSGHHARIETWRRQQALLRTWQRRPEMLSSLDLSGEDREFLASLEENKQHQGQHRDPETGSNFP